MRVSSPEKSTGLLRLFAHGDAGCDRLTLGVQRRVLSSPGRRCRKGHSSRVALAFALSWLILVDTVSARQEPVGQHPEVVAGARLHGPSRLVLGQKGAVQFVLQAPRAVAPRLTASVGRFDPPTARAEGGWQATYHPPPGREPAVAVVVARDADGELLAWAVLPLWGRPTVLIQSEPHAHVSLRVGDVDYGPTRADARGQARLRPIVAPGVRRYRLSARDAMGNRRNSTRPLPVTPKPVVLALCPPASDDRLWLLAVDARGRPDRRARLRAGAEGAELSKPEPLAPGVWVARLTPKSETEQRRTTVRVRRRRGGSVVAECQASLAGELPTGAAISLEASGQTAQSPPRAQAGASLTLRVRLNYAGRRWRVPDAPTLSATVGQLGEPRKVGDGEFVVPWQAPQRLEGRDVARVSVHLPRSGVNSEFRVPLKAGPVARIEARFSRSWVVADGRGSVALHARALDSFGNPVRSARLIAYAFGVQSGLRVDEAGRGSALLRTPVVADARVARARVEAASTGVAGWVQIRLVPPGPRVEVSARVGLSHNLGWVAAPMSLIRLRAHLPFGDGAAFAGVQGGWFGGGSERASRAGSAAVRAGVSAVPALALAGYRLPLGPVELSGGVQGGVLFARTRAESAATGDTQEDVVPFAYGGFFAAQTSFGPGHILGEAAWLDAQTQGSVSGNIAGLQLSTGYALDL